MALINTKQKPQKRRNFPQKIHIVNIASTETRYTHCFELEVTIKNNTTQITYYNKYPTRANIWSRGQKPP